MIMVFLCSLILVPITRDARRQAYKVSTDAQLTFYHFGMSTRTILGNSHTRASWKGAHETIRALTSIPVMSI